MTDKELFRQALEALEALRAPKSEDDYYEQQVVSWTGSAITALRERLAREDEPACPYIRSSKEGTHWCALAEQPREWVGLTEKEAMRCLGWALQEGGLFKNTDVLRYAEAIEAKLKEKNGQ